ncbi:MAG TPA: ATP-dependent Clp protease adaptor ClpS [Acidimicrobiales bacterium]|jgi:ATP-dependent Clp protease adapter protein ClpS|nr:ATP-dependent Clp protease adaptor ClpS [Acidimicrobiales bacterium]
MTQTVELPAVSTPDADELLAHEDLWAVIAWNDDVTTFETVIKAFVDIFGHSPERAERLAWQIHRTGKAVVAVRPKAEAEDAVRRLHQRKIQATLDRA